MILRFNLIDRSENVNINEKYKISLKLNEFN